MSLDAAFDGKDMNCNWDTEDEKAAKEKEAKAAAKIAQLKADKSKKNAIDGKDVDDLVNLLKEYEKWEAQMILDQEAWNNGQAELPTLTYPLYDKLMELQAKRNDLLKRFRNAS